MNQLIWLAGVLILGAFLACGPAAPQQENSGASGVLTTPEGQPQEQPDNPPPPTVCITGGGPNNTDLCYVPEPPSPEDLNTLSQPLDLAVAEARHAAGLTAGENPSDDLGYKLRPERTEANSQPIEVRIHVRNAQGMTTVTNWLDEHELSYETVSEDLDIYAWVPVLMLPELGEVNGVHHVREHKPFHHYLIN